MISKMVAVSEDISARDVPVRLGRDQAVGYLILACITLLAAGTRFFRLGQWSFWEDEIFTLRDAQLILQHVTVIPPPSLSTILTGIIVQRLGTSEWSARLAAALIGVVSVPVLFFIVQKPSSRAVALISALFLALAPWHIFWSQNARFYTALLLFYTLSLLCFFIGLERDRFRYIGLSIIFFVLAVGERLSAGLLVPVVACYLLLAWRLPVPKPAGLRRTNLLPLLGLTIVGTTFEATLLVVRREQLLSNLVQEFVGNPIHDPARLLYQILYKLGVPLVIFGLVSGIYLIAQKNRLALLLVCAAILPILVLTAISPVIFVEDRYALVTLPTWIMLTALGLQESAAGLIRSAKLLPVGVLLALVAVSLSADLLYYTINDGDHPDWRRAFATVRAQFGPADRLVSTWPEVGNFYMGGDVQRFAEVDPATVAASSTTYWFVVDARTIWTAPVLKNWLEENASLVDRLPLRIPEDEGLLIFRYEPTDRHRDLAGACTGSRRATDSVEDCV
jgi:4-amino-4-deoxy-L-arabinose transferase-like glycosyltransferase